MSSRNVKKVQSKRKSKIAFGNTSRGVTTRELSGGKYSPATNPPDVTAQPWYPLNLAWVAKPSNVTLGDIVSLFIRQLDPTGHGLNSVSFDNKSASAFRVQFRLQRVAVWNLTGRAISLTVWDDLEKDNTTKDQLGGWTDCGGANCFPALGFVYPLSHRNRVHRPDPDLKDTIVFNTTASSSNDQILAHLQILWRFDGSVKVLGVISTPTEEILNEIKVVSQKVVDSQPSTISRVIDGVKASAAVVAAVSATNFASATSLSDPEVDHLVELVVQRLAIDRIIEDRSSNTDELSGFTEP